MGGGSVPVNSNASIFKGWWVLFFLLVWEGPALQAQRPDGGDRPPSRFQQDRPDREAKVRRGRDESRPKPFLMASDPRFEKMLNLALVKEDELEEAIRNWPEYQEMKPIRRQSLERRLANFRERIRSEAMENAESMELTIPAEREDEFIRDYWTARIQIEKEVREMAEAELRERSSQVRKRIQQKWK